MRLVIMMKHEFLCLTDYGWWEMILDNFDINWIGELVIGDYVLKDDLGNSYFWDQLGDFKILSYKPRTLFGWFLIKEFLERRKECIQYGI